MCDKKKFEKFLDVYGHRVDSKTINLAHELENSCSYSTT